MDKQPEAVASTDPLGRLPERLIDADMEALAAVAHQAGLGGIDLYALARVLDAAQRIAVAAERERLRALIADDASAMTYQTMGQYRSALLNTLKA